MYSFTDPRLLTAPSNNNSNSNINNNHNSNSSSNNKSPLLSPSTSFASMHPFFQVFGHLPAFSPFHHLATSSSHLHPPHNPFYHSSLRQSPISHANASNSPNFFLFPHLPTHLQHPPQLSIPSSPKAPLQTSPVVISNANSTPPATVSSTTNNNTLATNGKVYYSNKRKEYEAREEKKAAFKQHFTESSGTEACNDSPGKSFSCPICLESTFSSNALKQHFELELKKFKQAENSRNNKLNNNDIDIESVDEDDDVFTNRSNGLSPCSPCSSSSPTTVSSVHERWEKFRSIRRNRCRRQHQGLIGRYTWNATSLQTSASTDDHALRGSPVSPLVPNFSSLVHHHQTSNSISPATAPTGPVNCLPFSHNPIPYAFLGDANDCTEHFKSHNQSITLPPHGDEVQSKKPRLSLGSTSSSSSISASSSASVCSNNSRSPTPTKDESASLAQK